MPEDHIRPMSIDRTPLAASEVPTPPATVEAEEWFAQRYEGCAHCHDHGYVRAVHHRGDWDEPPSVEWVPTQDSSETLCRDADPDSPHPSCWACAVSIADGDWTVRLGARDYPMGLCGDPVCLDRLILRCASREAVAALVHRIIADARGGAR